MDELVSEMEYQFEMESIYLFIRVSYSSTPEVNCINAPHCPLDISNTKLFILCLTYHTM